MILQHKDAQHKGWNIDNGVGRPHFFRTSEYESDYVSADKCRAHMIGKTAYDLCLPRSDFPILAQVRRHFTSHGKAEEEAAQDGNPFRHRDSSVFVSNCFHPVFQVARESGKNHPVGYDGKWQKRRENTGVPDKQTVCRRRYRGTRIEQKIENHSKYQ